MIDTWSDGIDWIFEITWNGAGIAASILVAVIMVSTILWNIAASTIRARKRHKLVEFVSEGQELLELCSTDPPDDRTKDWAERAQGYLGQHLGPRSVAIFGSNAGLPPLRAYTNSKDEGLELAIKIRLARLEQFLTELR